MTGETSELLQQFPGPIVLLTSRKQWLEVAYFAFWFTLVFSLLAASNDPNHKTGLVIACFAGLTTFASSALGFFPNLISLQLDKDGFTMFQLFHSRRYLWRDVRDLQVWTAIGPRGDKMHGIGFMTPKLNSTVWDKINLRMSHCNGFLPYDIGGLSGEDLVELLTAWQSQAMDLPLPIEQSNRLLIPASKNEGSVENLRKAKQPD
jgi:hypothetical protein